MSVRQRFASPIAPTLVALAAVTGWGMSGYGWSAEPAPVAEMQMTDGAVLMAHWDATPWGKTWASPAMKPLRETFAQWQAAQVATLGAEPTAFLAAITNLGLTVRPSAEPHAVAVLASADFGTFAKALYDKAKTAESNKGTVDAKVPGADESFHSLAPDEVANVLARFGSSLVAAFHSPAVKPQPRATPLADDAVITIQVMQLLDVIEPFVTEEQQKQSLTQMRSQFTSMHTGEASYRLRIVPEGFLERIEIVTDKMPGYAEVDLTQMGRLPGNTLMAMGMGIDGKAYWTAQREQTLVSWAPLLQMDPADPAAIEQKINESLAGFGLPITLSELMEGLVGTMVFGVTPGMPFPGITMTFPRSTAVDKLISMGLAKMESESPTVGNSIILPIPNMPVAVSLACDQAHWMISSDAIYVDQWLAGTPNGWLDSAATKAVLAKAPKDAYLIGSSDTPAVLRLIAGYAGMALGMAKTLPQDQKQAILQGLTLLAQNASTGYLFAGTQGPKYVVEMRSITGTVTGLGLAGGIAGLVAYQQKLLAVVDQNEPDTEVLEASDNSPVTILRSVIYPAEIQFQGGTYIDQDGDGVGEYGLLSEISGRRPVATGKIELVEGPLATSATVEGYSYTIYLPGGVARVADDGKSEPRVSVVKDAEAQESAFVAYSWPAKGKEGEMFAVGADGTVYQADYTGNAPAWNALFGGKGWADAPTWKAVDDSEDANQEADPMTEEAPIEPVPTVIP